VPKSAFFPPPTVIPGLKATLEKREVLPESWNPTGAEAAIELFYLDVKLPVGAETSGLGP